MPPGVKKGNLIRMKIRGIKSKTKPIRETKTTKKTRATKGTRTTKGTRVTKARVKKEKIRGLRRKT